MDFKSKDIKWLNGLKNQDLYICCLQETHFRSGETHKLKVREWRRLFYANENQKKVRVTILILDKIDFKDYYKKQKSHNDQGISLRIKHHNCKYIYPQHRSISIYKGLLKNIKGETDSQTIIVGDFKHPIFIHEETIQTEN